MLGDTGVRLAVLSSMLSASLLRRRTRPIEGAAFVRAYIVDCSGGLRSSGDRAAAF